MQNWKNTKEQIARKGTNAIQFDFKGKNIQFKIVFKTFSCLFVIVEDILRFFPA